MWSGHAVAMSAAPPPDEPGPGGRPESLSRALAWLVHPVTVAAVVLLVLNDHLLKAACPGWFTGKLSDVAGLMMAPPLVALLLAVVRPRFGPDRTAVASVVVVGVGFAVVKAFPVAAAAASSGWSVLRGPSIVLADRTDLLALPVLLITWSVARSARVRLELRPWLRLVGVVVVLPVAGLAVAATSAPWDQTAVGLGDWRGHVVVGLGDAYRNDRTPLWALISDDEGETFRYFTEAEQASLADDEPTTLRAGTTSCSDVSPEHCFRVIPGRLGAEETEDGGRTWRVAWAVDDAARARLAKTLPRLDDVGRDLSSVVLMVRDQPDGRVVVLVANGRDGLARRDSSGHWSRLGLGPGEAPRPIPDAGPLMLVDLIPLALAWSGTVAAVVIGLGLMFASRPLIGVNLSWIGSLATLPGLLVVGFSRSDDPISFDFIRIAGLIVVGLGLATSVIVGLSSRATNRRGAALVEAIGLAGGVAVLAPSVIGLTLGWPRPGWLALVISVGGAAAAIAAGIVAGRRYARPAARPANGTSATVAR